MDRELAPDLCLLGKVRHLHHMWRVDRVEASCVEIVDVRFIKLLYSCSRKYKFCLPTHASKATDDPG
jgi:hypothetical protein